MNINNLWMFYFLSLCLQKCLYTVHSSLICLIFQIAWELDGSDKAKNEGVGVQREKNYVRSRFIVKKKERLWAVENFCQNFYASHFVTVLVFNLSLFLYEERQKGNPYTPARSPAPQHPPLGILLPTLSSWYWKLLHLFMVPTVSQIPSL